MPDEIIPVCPRSRCRSVPIAAGDAGVGWRRVGKLVISVLLLVVVSYPAQALKVPTQDHPGSGAEVPPQPQSQQQPLEPETVQPPVKRPGPPPASGQFTPSERIEADSAVSFPVDI